MLLLCLDIFRPCHRMSPETMWPHCIPKPCYMGVHGPATSLNHAIWVCYMGVYGPAASLCTYANGTLTCLVPVQDCAVHIWHVADGTRYALCNFSAPVCSLSVANGLCVAGLKDGKISVLETDTGCVACWMQDAGCGMMCFA